MYVWCIILAHRISYYYFIHCSAMRYGWSVNPGKSGDIFHLLCTPSIRQTFPLIQHKHLKTTTDWLLCGCRLQGWDYQPRGLERHTDSILGWVSAMQQHAPTVYALKQHIALYRRKALLHIAKNILMSYKLYTMLFTCQGERYNSWSDWSRNMKCKYLKLQSSLCAYAASIIGISTGPWSNGWRWPGLKHVSHTQLHHLPVEVMAPGCIMEKSSMQRHCEALGKVLLKMFGFWPSSPSTFICNKYSSSSRIMCSPTL